jgi:hypothetical protein
MGAQGMQSLSGAQIKTVAGLCFAATVLVSAYRIFNTMLNHDVAGFLLDARAFELGRRLYESFFEMNMPSNVWLPILSVSLAHVVPRPLAEIHFAVLFLFVLLCTGTTVVLIWRIIGPRRPVTVVAASALIPATFLLYPAYDFGQREVLFLAAFAPLVAATVGRHYGYVPSIWTSIGVAALAAFGASQKPHFMLMAAGFVFVDFCIRRGRPLRMGAEAFALAAFFVAYVAWIVLVHPTYLTDTVPSASATYLTMTEPFSIVLQALRWKRLSAFAAISVILMSVVVYLHRMRDLGAYLKLLLFWLALIAFSAAIYFVQSLGFPYHQFLLIAVVILSGGLMLSWFFDELIITTFPDVSWVRRLPVSIALAGVCLCYAWLVADKATIPPPVMTREAALNDPMTRILNSLPSGTPVLMLLTNIVPISPLHAYADVRWTGQFSTLVIVRAIYSERDRALAEGREMNPTIAKADRDIRRYVLNSLRGVPPEIVFVDITKPLRWFETYPRPVSILDYLSEQPEFAAEWAKYKRVGEIHSLFDIDIAIYSRRKDA